MPTGLHHPALIKALRTGAFFIWALAAGLALARTEIETTASAVDGDMLLLQDRSFVRLIGINAPELGKDGRPAEPLAREAKQALAELINGQPLRLMFEAESHDHYGRHLAHALLPDGRDVGEALLARGLACAVAIPPNIGRFADYQRIETSARAARLGLWGNSYYVPIPAERIGPELSGFRFVTGTVLRVTSSRHGTYLWLGEEFAVHVPHADRHHFSRPLRELEGYTVEVRGWISAKNGKPRMKIQHPGMLRVLERAPTHEKSYYSPLSRRMIL